MSTFSFVNPWERFEWIKAPTPNATGFRIERMRKLKGGLYECDFFTPGGIRRFVHMTADMKEYECETTHPFQKITNDLSRKLISDEEREFWRSELMMRGLE